MQFAPLVQSVRLHNEQLELSHRLHEEEILTAEHLHRDAMTVQAQLHKHSTSLALELHAAEMHHKAELARREAIRDVWQQRNMLAQTLMIVNTLMFGCIFNALSSINGTLSASTSRAESLIFFSFVSLSFVFLCTSMWCCLSLQYRMARYDLYRPLLRYCCDRTHEHFNSYFRCHCQKLDRVLVATFVAGTLSATVANSMVFRNIASLNLGDDVAAYIFIALTAATVIVWIVLEICFPSPTHMPEHHRSAEFVQGFGDDPDTELDFRGSPNDSRSLQRVNSMTWA